MIHIENIKFVASHNFFKELDGLEINNLGDVNLFTGIYWSGGFQSLFYDLEEKINVKNKPSKIACVSNYCSNIHHSYIISDMERCISDRRVQLFWQTHSLDTIKSFIKVGKDNPNLKFMFFRIGKSRFDGKPIATSYTLEELDCAVNHLNLEVR